MGYYLTSIALLLLTIAIAVVIFIMNRVGFDAGQLVGQGHKEK